MRSVPRSRHCTRRSRARSHHRGGGRSARVLPGRRATRTARRPWRVRPLAKQIVSARHGRWDLADQSGTGGPARRPAAPARARGASRELDPGLDDDPAAAGTAATMVEWSRRWSASCAGAAHAACHRVEHAFDDLTDDAGGRASRSASVGALEAWLGAHVPPGRLAPWSFWISRWSRASGSLLVGAGAARTPSRRWPRELGLLSRCGYRA